MVGSFAAGFLGSLTGLGGGIVVVPTLTLLFHVDLRSAIGASLVSVIATSSGAAAPYVREGYTTIRNWWSPRSRDHRGCARRRRARACDADERTCHPVWGGAVARRTRRLLPDVRCLLIGTPIARVALILLAIALQRDRLYEQRFPGPRRVMRGHVGDPKPGPQ
jgi:hypothetical protein